MNDRAPAYLHDGYYGIARIDPNLEDGDQLPDGRSVVYANAPYLIVTERSGGGRRITWVKTGPGVHIFPLRLDQKASWQVGLLLQQERYDELSETSRTNPLPKPKGLGGYVLQHELVLDAIRRLAREKVGMRVDTPLTELILLPRFLPIGVIDIQIIHHICIGAEEKQFPGDKNCTLKYYELTDAVEMAVTNKLFDAATTDGIHKIAHWTTSNEGRTMRQKLREQATRKKKNRERNH